MLIDNTQKYQDSLLYKSGDVFLSKNIRNFLETPIYGHYNKTTVYLTYWSILHLISGMLFELYLKYYLKFQNFNTRLIIGILFHSLWELWQVFIGMASPYRLTGKSGLIDSFVDTIMFLLGMLIIHKFT